MWRINRSTTQPIGLDIGHDGVKLLQLKVCTDGDGPAPARSLSVVAAARAATPEAARQDPAKRAELSAGVIRTLLAQQPFEGRDVVTTLPRELVHIKNLRLPPIPADELEAAVRFEAKSIFPFDTDSARVDFLPAGEVRQGSELRQEVIVLAVKNVEIDRHLEQLDRCGLTVRGLDVEITAIFRCFERFVRRREDEQEAQMLIDVGARRTQVVIGKGRDVCFYKPVEIGGLHLLDAVSRKLGITVEEARAVRQRLSDNCDPAEVISPDALRRDPVRQAVFDATRGVAEDLGQELAMCLRYFTVTFRGLRTTRAKLLGGEAADPQLQTILKTALSIPVEAARPLANIDTAQMRPVDRCGPLSAWALATGLSLRFVPGYFASKDGRPRLITSAADVPKQPDRPGPIELDGGQVPDAAVAQWEVAGA